jgi:5'-methylthioadenosine phosphorylase
MLGIEVDIPRINCHTQPSRVTLWAMSTVAAIVGSAFTHPDDLGLDWEGVEVDTPHGPYELFRVCAQDRAAYLILRHGCPHRWLPHQIPYRAQALALKAVGVRSLLVTSSVGVLDPELPLFQPLLVADLVTADNRLPDGSACSIWREPQPEQGHLVLEHGLFDAELGEQLVHLSGAAGMLPAVFGYVPGPRTKTAAENRMWKSFGVQVNSMTLAPEVILANELGIPTAAVVIGHKYSLGDGPALGQDALRASLDDSREATRSLVQAFLARGWPVPFKNSVYGFS